MMPLITLSPLFQLSVGGEPQQQHPSFFLGDDSSNDALVIVDDTSAASPAPTPTGKRGRGRPKGSGTGRGRPRGRGGTKRALSAAEIAGAQAGMTAAYAAYGYNLTGSYGGVLIPLTMILSCTDVTLTLWKFFSNQTSSNF